MWRKPGNSDIKSTRIYIWRRWIQSVNGWRHCGCESKLQIHQGTLFQVDIVNVSLMDELLAHPPSLCLCLFHPWYKPRCFWSMMEGPNQGTKDVMRHPDQCHIWWIDGLWSEFYTVTWESTVDVDFIWDPSIGSSLLGRPHRVMASSSDPMDVAQGIRSWLWLDFDAQGLSVPWERHGCDSSHHGNNPAAFRRLATQPSR
jgi:hypothetical protein